MRVIALAAVTAASLHATTVWERKENTWACYSRSMVEKQVVEFRTNPQKVRIDVSREIANKRCVGIPKGTILHSYEGGGADTLSVILNHSYYDHFNQRWRTKESWHTPLRFIKWPPLQP